MWNPGTIGSMLLIRVVHTNPVVFYGVECISTPWEILMHFLTMSLILFWYVINGYVTQRSTSFKINISDIREKNYKKWVFGPSCVT